MNKGAGLIVPILFMIGSYIGLPAVMISGWVRWAKRRTPGTLFGTLSLIGFTLGTSSGLLAFSSIIYAFSVGFPYYDPLLLRIYLWGGLLSLAGIAFAIGGAWRPNPLRWYAPVFAVGMLLFWFMAASGE